jgi:hypothetical protein
MTAVCAGWSERQIANTYFTPSCLSGGFPVGCELRVPMQEIQEIEK